MYLLASTGVKPVTVALLATTSEASNPLTASLNATSSVNAPVAPSTAFSVTTTVGAARSSVKLSVLAGDTLPEPSSWRTCTEFAPSTAVKLALHVCPPSTL